MIAIQGFNTYGVIYHWNEACRQLYGHSAEEAIGKRMQDILVSGDDVDMFEKTIKDIIETGKPAQCRVWKLKTKAGGLIWAYSSMFPIYEQGKIVEIYCMDVDITERKRMEESLSESEEQLRTLINAMPDIVCFKDGEGRWLQANDFDLRLFELEGVDYKGKKDSELAEYSSFYRDAFLLCEDTDEVAWRSGKTCVNEEVIPRPDGTSMTFETIKVPLFHPDGARKGLVVIGRDITRRKKAEEELKSSYEDLEKIVEERTGELTQARNTLQAILDTVPVGVIMAESHPERITYFSQNAINILGGDVSKTSFDPEPRPYEVLKPDGSRFDPGEQPLHRSLYKGSHVFNSEGIVRRKDGSEVFILMSSAPVKGPDGEITAAVACIIDVTELRRADNALKASEKFLKDIFDGIQDGISVLDKDMNIMRVNHTMEKWYPDMVPLEGKKCYEAYHKRLVPCEKCPTLIAISSRTIRSEAVPIVREDGGVGWLELYSFPLIDDEGNVTGVIEHVRDITDRRKAEVELLDAKSQAELYIDLMGHDINNINQVVTGYLELVEGMQGVNEEVCNMVARSLEMLRNSSQLIDNVMILQRAKSGGIRFKKVYAGKTLKEAIEECSKIGDKEMAISINMPGQDILVNANELLKDVFSNLIGNSIKHSLPGKPIMININVDKDIRDGQEYCRIAIEDNGPGIPDAIKERIYNRHSRGDTKTAGKGLGLYLVKTLVESYRGKVWVEDRVAGEYSKGSKFVIMLPVP